jgi:hypothetical protein
MQLSSMPDSRLDDLQRQRALIQEHLAWLDRQIAANAVTPAVLPPLTAQTASVPAPIRLGSPQAIAPSGSGEFEEYQPDAARMESDAKKGCLLYAVAGFLLFFATLVAVYFIGYRDHPLFGTPRSPPAQSAR